MPTVMPTDLRISNELLSDDVQRLFDSTETFRCADLGTSSCVLAAAAGVDNEREFVEWCSLLQSARQYFPATTTSAFNDLILGPPVTLNDEGEFFKLLELVKKLKVVVVGAVSSTSSRSGRPRST